MGSVNKNYLILIPIACLMAVTFFYYSGNYEINFKNLNFSNHKEDVSLCSFLHRGMTSLKVLNHQQRQQICLRGTNDIIYMDSPNSIIAEMTKNPFYNECGLLHNLQYIYIPNSSKGQYKYTMVGKRFNVEKQLMEKMGIPIKEKVWEKIFFI